MQQKGHLLQGEALRPQSNFRKNLPEGHGSPPAMSVINKQSYVRDSMFSALLNLVAKPQQVNPHCWIGCKLAQQTRMCP